MRRIMAVLVMAALLLAMTGCIDVVEHVTVNSDGSADVERTITVDKQALASLSESTGEETAEDPFAETQGEMESEGWTVTSIDEETKAGLRAEKHIGDVADLASELGTDYAGGVRFESGLMESSYSVDLAIDNEGDAPAEGEPDFSSAMTMKFELTLPGTIAEHNGTVSEEDPNTIVWDISPTGTTEISARSTAFGPGGGMLISVGIGCGCCLLLLVVLIVILVMLRGRKKRAAQAAAPPAQYPPQQYPPPAAPQPYAPPAAPPQYAPPPAAPPAAPEPPAAPAPEAPPAAPGAPPEAPGE